MTADADGRFELGRIEEDSRDDRNSRHMTFHVADRCDVRVSALGAHFPEPHYVGVSVPGWLVLRSVRLPDGTPAATAGATISLYADALHCGDVHPSRMRDLVDVHATVTLAGYEDLEIVWTLADAAPAHVLVPITADSAE